jgi:hypothetical protein
MPGDVFEQEADRVAKQVTASPAGRVVSGSTTPARSPAGQQPASPPASVGRTLDAPGTPIDSTLRHDMEQRFGSDFAHVRLHRGSPAEESAREVNARAYTVGRHIVFGAGMFAPATHEGRRLLAHELVHVVQQSEADGSTRRSMTGRSALASSGSGAAPALLQRQPVSAQASSTAAAPTQEATAAPASAGGATTGSALRDELLQLFTEFDKQVVGDEKFDAIITKEDWDDKKEKERLATIAYEEKKKKYEEDKQKYARREGPKPTPPIPVAKFTTCIVTQATLLQEALKRKGLSIKSTGKKPRFDFATEGQKNAEKIGPGVWHKATPGTKDRPRPGDIFVLAKRGAKVDKTAQELSYITSTAAGNITKKGESNDRAQAALTAAEAATSQAQEALTALEEAEVSHTDAAYLKAKGSLAAAVTALKTAKKKAGAAASALEQAQGQVPMYTKKLEQARGAVDHDKVFEFSHVGFLQKIDPVLNADGTENWLTFDGGQTVQSKGSKQGAESVRRKYDPATNEISGEKSQGGDARWLQGWIDVDALVARPTK